MGEMSSDLRNLINNLHKMADAQKMRALQAGKRTADSLGAESKITGNRYLDVTFNKEDEPGGVIDLKKGFAKGSKVRHKRNGGWYTIVPISYKVSKMSNSIYQDVRDLRNESTSTSYIDYLYGGTPVTSDVLTAFGITTKPHGGNLTRVDNGTIRGSYFAFRTVSDKSSPSSWLLLKDTAKAQVEDSRKLKQIGDAIQDTIMDIGKDMS